MSKKSNQDFEDLVGIVFGLVVLGLLGLWFNNRAKFYVYITIILFVIAIIIFAGIKIKKGRFNKISNWHHQKDLIKKLQAMHPNDFEDYIADLYRRLGYKTEVRGGSYDGGIDVVATKKGLNHYIQCKKYISSKVGVSEVRDFYGAMAGKLADGKGVFVTTNVFTTEAERFADDKPIELIDGDRLIRLVKSVKKNKEPILATQDNKCPRCGGELVKKTGRYGPFFACSNFPKCRFIKGVSGS